MNDPPVPSEEKTPWYRRRGVLFGLVIVAVIGITVITDLPVGTSRGSDIAAERSIMTELNTDLAPCAVAVKQAIGIWDLQAAHRLSAIDRSPTPGLLSDDQAACSFTNEDIFDLSNIEVSETPAGKHLGQLVATATLWTTSDALGAIEDVQTLMNNPNDAAALAKLRTEEARLASDRRAGIADEDAADHVLATRLPRADLPSLPKSR